MSIRFESSSSFSLGAELELQLVNAKTFELSSSSVQILKMLGETSSVSAELYQSMIEITTGVCGNAFEVGAELSASLQRVTEIADRLGVELVAAGTHPWSDHQDARVFPRARYDEVLERRKWIARRLLVFGLHVHVGMRSGDHAIRTMNAMNGYLPLLLALSASSPFSHGENTGLSSSRSTYIESLPTGGQPFALNDWSEFQAMYSRLVSSGAIIEPKDLWWDIRPSPAFGTLEIRICDAPSTLREASALVALIQLLCVKVENDFLAGRPVPSVSPWIARENKWRAMKDGAGAEFIVDDVGRTEPVLEIFEELVSETKSLIAHYAYNPHIEVLRRILTMGSSSERQTEVFENSKGDLRAVVAVLVEELQKDRPMWLTGKKKGRGICA